MQKGDNNVPCCDFVGGLKTFSFFKNVIDEIMTCLEQGFSYEKYSQEILLNINVTTYTTTLDPSFSNFLKANRFVSVELS